MLREINVLRRKENSFLFYNHDAIAFLEIHCQTWPLSSLAPGFLAHASHTKSSHTPREPRWLDAACPWCIRKCGSVAIVGPKTKPRRSLRGSLPRHVRKRNQNTNEVPALEEQSWDEVRDQEDDPVLGKRRNLRHYYCLQVKFFQACYQQNESFSLVYYDEALKFLNIKVHSRLGRAELRGVFMAKNPGFLSWRSNNRDSNPRCPLILETDMFLLPGVSVLLRKLPTEL